MADERPGPAEHVERPGATDDSATADSATADSATADSATADSATGDDATGDPPDPHRFGRPGPPLRRGPFLIGFTGALGVLLAYALFLAVRNAASMLILILVALFLAIGLDPAVARLRKWGLPRGVAVAAVALTALLLLGGGLFALVPPLVTQSAQFIEHLPTYVDDLRRNETVNDLIERYHLMDRVESAASPDVVGQAAGGVFGGARLLFGTVFNVLTVVVLTIYFLAAFERIKALGYALVPASRRERVRLLGDEILAKVGAYMVGALAVALLAGIATFVFATVVDLRYPFALAIVVAVCDLIPQIGATLGAILVSLVGFATSLPVGIACLVFFVVYQQVENYLIYPKVMRRSVQVSDVAAIAAALLGVALLGVIGALIAIPAVAAIQLILREVVLPRQQQG
ncbi:Predicted PurR-regulated permease PerM [Micromonospora pattaloongensis]|uniref:Predicted PurR-regulated permease PerM n=1 Tax=Micromonospora pattaloongensis TaxID=405436 RepID=A0A1H3LN10_9ACTN|nr:AI-2E family transporter [Micromonospora pattaloongensis]SDY65927.1 Predicted PurR-regulated permease PerM [Micromonospora pattaloongensis]